jgi:hypothetical protein
VVIGGFPKPHRWSISDRRLLAAPSPVAAMVGRLRGGRPANEQRLP